MHARMYISMYLCMCVRVCACVCNAMSDISRRFAFVFRVGLYWEKGTDRSSAVIRQLKMCAMIGVIVKQITNKYSALRYQSEFVVLFVDTTCLRGIVCVLRSIVSCGWLSGSTQGKVPISTVCGQIRIRYWGNGIKWSQEKTHTNMSNIKRTRKFGYVTAFEVLPMSERTSPLPYH